MLRRVTAETLVSSLERVDPVSNLTVLSQAENILQDIKQNGKSAVIQHAVRLGDLKDPQQQAWIDKTILKAAFDGLPKEQQLLLERVKQRIESFAKAQRNSIQEFESPVPGGIAAQKVVPVERAGCYAPGGRFPLPSSVLMTAVTAKVAGVEHVIVASPRPQEITKAAAYVAGADGLLAIGGAQAVGVFAYGCPGLGVEEPVDVIVGPGNAWVTAAKKLVVGKVAIDMLAGPSELLVLADDSADPEIIAADLLAQAEHDVVALPVLVTTSKELLEKVEVELKKQLEVLPTKETASASLKNGFAVLVRDLDEAVKIANQVAPEHLELLVKDLSQWEPKLKHYGALFVGTYAAEVLGDYGIGPNHTLPTSQTSKSSGGLSVFNFLRIRTVLRITGKEKLQTPEGRLVVEDAVELAKLEGLIGHSRSAEKRLFEVKTSDDASESSCVNVVDMIRPDFRSMDHYAPIEPIEKIAKAYGLDPKKIAKLDGNENLYGMIPEVKEALLKSFSTFNIYPDPYMTSLRESLAKYHKISSDNIVCGSGSDEVLDLLVRLFAPKVILSCPPTFGMYKFLADVNATKLVEVVRGPSPSFAVNINELINAIRSTDGSKILFLASPNNPTGGVISNEDVERLCKENCIIVLDEAYVDFVSKQNFKGGLDLFSSGKYPNLVLLRTFSKWAGLAGLRIGYGIMHTEIASRMMQMKQPYNVNVAAAVAAETCLNHRNSIIPQIEGMKMERMRIFEQLSQFGWIHPVQSEANFVLCKLDGYPPKLLQNNLRQHGVFARCYSTGKGTGLLEEYIRFSCGRPQDTDLIIRSLSKHYESSDFAKSLNETLDLLDVHMLSKVKVILFDMDGVLADVSRSYREAIIQTAAHYGVKITMDDIDFYKNKGNANNDWVLTQKILHENGHSHIDLKEVTNRFQELYEGGLRDTEALMCSQSFIEMLSKQYTLAVVTGRPRAEAEYFLNLHSIRKFFTTLVCMEDTEHPKPHPAPVHLALDLLKCTQDVPCIFIGDTPDDILAGLRAQRRVIPIGLGVKHAAALFRSGAPRVLSNLHDLEYILSPKQNSGSEGSSDSKRSARVSRKTKETQIEVFVDIDGSGRSDISSGVGFLNHMLEALSKHSRMDISLTCVGDLHIDDHHTVEDCALALGEAILKALGSKAGISRFGSAIAPLDESLSRAVIDISGRPHCEVNLELTNPKVGDLSSEMISHFFQSLSVSMKSTIHLDVLRGQNHHHKAEASFKAFALAIRQAVQKTSFQDIPSTKGVL